MNEAPVKMTSPCSIPPHSRRIDPTQARTATFKPDGSDNNNDCVEIGPTPLAFAQDLGSQPLHLPTMRAYRLQRICEQLISRDLGGILLFDPLDIRYATDSTNMQLWATHNPARACFVAASGYIVLLDFHGCNHLSAHLPLIKGAVANDLLLITLATLSDFTLVYVLTGGSNMNTELMTIYQYRQAFQFYQIGYGSAVALLIIVVGAILALIYTHLLRIDLK